MVLLGIIFLSSTEIFHLQLFCTIFFHSNKVELRTQYQFLSVKKFLLKDLWLNVSVTPAIKHLFMYQKSIMQPCTRLCHAEDTVASKMWWGLKDDKHVNSKWQFQGLQCCEENKAGYWRETNAGSWSAFERKPDWWGALGHSRAVKQMWVFVQGTLRETSGAVLCKKGAGQEEMKSLLLLHQVDTGWDSCWLRGFMHWFCYFTLWIGPLSYYHILVYKWDWIRKAGKKTDLARREWFTVRKPQTWFGVQAPPSVIWANHRPSATSVSLPENANPDIPPPPSTHQVKRHVWKPSHCPHVASGSCLSESQSVFGSWETENKDLEKKGI